MCRSWEVFPRQADPGRERALSRRSEAVRVDELAAGELDAGCPKPKWGTPALSVARCACSARVVTDDPRDHDPSELCGTVDL